MRKTTEIIITVGGVFSGVGALLLVIYLEDAKRFLDDLLGRLFGIPKSMVGYNVVTIVIIGFIAYAILSTVIFLTIWILDRISLRKHPV